MREVSLHISGNMHDIFVASAAVLIIQRTNADTN